MPDLLPVVLQASQSANRALADLDALQSATDQARVSLQAALREAERGAALAGFDQAALQEFMDRPYLLQRAGQDSYRLIVPRFLGFRGGWLERHDGAYSVFVVNRFAHLINPLPDWLAAEAGIEAPKIQALLDGTVLTVTAGDAGALADRMGKGVVRREGNRLHLRPASRQEVMRRLIREEGILPFAPQPVPAALQRGTQVALDEKGNLAFVLRDHQLRDYQRFLTLGAVLVVAFPQTGKTFLALRACADLVGAKIVFCPRRSLVEQWKARLALYLTPAAAAEVTVTTYQSAAKYMDQDFTLAVFDEAHRVPADFAIETASAIRAQARIGLSATPFREDGQHDLMPMLCGFPVGADWPVTALQKPDVIVWIVPDENAKVRHTRELVAAPVNGKTFVFVQRLEIGQRLADALDVPFVSGKTPARRQFAIIQENDTVVLSSVGDEGLSANVARIIEVDFLFGSRMQAGQRLGRLANVFEGKKVSGAHHVLMTPQEYQDYGKRLLAYESWGLRLDIRVPDGGDGAPVATVRPARAAKKAARPTAPAREADPADEIDQVLALPSVAAKFSKAQAAVPGEPAKAMRSVFRYCWAAALSAKEMAEGLGVGDRRRAQLQQAQRALADVGLLTEKDGRYQVDQAEINRLRALSRLKGR